MSTVKALLEQLDLGKSVAEFDSSLEKYFIETSTFRSLTDDEFDIIAGDKGTGKTAIFRILERRYKSIESLKDVEFIPAFNPQGFPLFQKLAEKNVFEEGEYIRIWKAYILALAGNWLLLTSAGASTALTKQLSNLIDGLELRENNAVPETVFKKVLGKIGRLFNWKAASLEFGVNESGPTITPKIEFDNDIDSGKNDCSVNIEYALGLLNKCVEERGIKLWIAFDRLDEAFQSYPQTEIPALRALFRTYLDLREFSFISLKLFVRRDLFRRITEGGFVNLTHVNARKTEVIWDEDDLRHLICRRVRENTSFCQHLDIQGASDEVIFNRIFPLQVDFGKRKPATWTWITRRIRDGNNIKPPRNLIDLISFARHAQLRREERETRQLKPGEPIIEADSLRRALSRLSDARVEDTLLAEAGDNAKWIRRFENGKAEHDLTSLSVLFGVKNGELRTAIKSLVDIGFLEEIKDTYMVPSLYRDGLKITQGKAIEMASDPSDDT